MSSQLLVQRREDKARPTSSASGIQIVESKVESISISRAGPETRVNKARPFDFEVELNEKGRTSDGLRVSYSFRFGRPSSGQVFRMSGEAVARFLGVKAETDFDCLGNDITNELAVEIFRKNYECTYLLHEAMAMDAPSPWITQDVSLL